MEFERGDRVRSRRERTRRGVVTSVDRNDAGRPVYAVRWDGRTPPEYGWHTGDLESDS